jgi:hypothetical protein
LIRFTDQFRDHQALVKRFDFDRFDLNLINERKAVVKVLGRSGIFLTLEFIDEEKATAIAVAEAKRRALAADLEDAIELAKSEVAHEHDKDFWKITRVKN